MTIFNYLSDICGNNKPFTAEIRLLNNTDTDKGELVYFDEAALAATPEKGSRSFAAGVCAETYKASADPLVPAYGCGKISVIVSPGALYGTKAVTFKASANSDDGSITTDIEVAQITESTGVAGSEIVLVKKSETSQSTDLPGAYHKITSVSISGGKVKLTTDCDKAFSEGDTYAFVPTYGFELLGTDSEGNLALQFEEKGAFTVISADKNGYVLKLGNVR